MKVYLASRYSRIDELNEYKAKLEEMGEIVTSRWLNGQHQLHGYDAYRVARSSEGANELEQFPKQAALFAQDDYDDLYNADYIICFSEQPRNGDSGRGGRHIEFGLALAWGKPIFVIGPRENVFHCLPCVSMFSSFTEFLQKALVSENAK